MTARPHRFRLRRVWWNVKLGTQPARILAREDLDLLPRGTRFVYRVHKNGPREHAVIAPEGMPFLVKM